MVQRGMQPPLRKGAGGIYDFQGWGNDDRPHVELIGFIKSIQVLRSAYFLGKAVERACFNGKTTYLHNDSTFLCGFIRGSVSETNLLEKKMVTEEEKGKRLNVVLTPHDLRRYSATYASRNGVPLEIVSKVILRHQDLKTTQAYLGRVTESEAIRWMDVLHGR